MRLFISYARVDKPTVRQIVEILTDGDHEPWYDHQLKPGEKWEEQLEKAIQTTEVFIYMLSPESVVSGYCMWEFKQAVEMGKPILPLLLRAKTRIPKAISAIQYVDFTDGITATAVARLLGGLSNLAKKLPPKAVADVPEHPVGIPSSVDELYEKAVELAYEHDGISLGMLKRELNIGYSRAKNLMEMMQTQGVVGAYPGGGKLHPLI
jgi:DNA segregation ATPase FtsK/SpoIIIE-like protein